MDEIHSQGRKGLILLVVFAFSSTLLLGFSDISHHSSDSSALSVPTPLNAAEITLRQDIVGFARNYLGLKYRYAGRSPQTGFDCSGFTHFVMGTFGISLSPSSVQQSHQGEPIKVKETRTGDLIFFRRSPRSRISHVAMVVANDENGLFIIHSTSRGIVIDDLMHSSYWRPKIYSARRVIDPQNKEAVEAMQSFFGCDGDRGDVIADAEEAMEQRAILDERYYCLEPLPSIGIRYLVSANR